LLDELRAAWPPPAASQPEALEWLDDPDVARYIEVLIPDLLAAAWWQEPA
jgi:hypothetical protein